MRALVFGSMNIDHVYQLPHFLRLGETLASESYQRNAGGKGLNQAVALARAGQKTAFAGEIGADGLFLRELLDKEGVETAQGIRPRAMPSSRWMKRAATPSCSTAARTSA